MSLFGLIDWLLLSQAFEGGHFKKIEICFPHWFDASDTTPPCDRFPPGSALLCSLSGCGRGEPTVSDKLRECRSPRAAMANLFWQGGGDEFLEARIVAQWIEHWIEPEQRRSERRICGQGRLVWDRKQLL